jgi:hypothetical protein
MATYRTTQALTQKLLDLGFERKQFTVRNTGFGAVAVFRTESDVVDLLNQKAIMESTGLRVSDAGTVYMKGQN